MPEKTQPVTRAVPAGRTRIAVDRVACTGHGLCAQLLPASIALDEWGYPIVTDPEPASTDADVAIRFCPARALYARP
ncbi:MAG TPA: ferredoxin [Tetrasphaera sp.]|uniref:ferredoxin n=1 Tax=Nostocoides sp. TaxID=1917966 RepID=UPI002C3C9784|nr:ferredoxin [Tetrasphaera sp.]HNQ07900.1 ferredoxin [Tetrasphaera sp.]